MTDATARLRYLHIAPRKVRLVARLIRGMNVKEAQAQLRRMPQRSSLALYKLLRSCIANAKHTSNLEERQLYIGMLRVDGAPMLKRTFPRSRGRADIKRKRMSHITLILTDEPPSYGKKN